MQNNTNKVNNQLRVKNN